LSYVAKSQSVCDKRHSFLLVVKIIPQPCDEGKSTQSAGRISILGQVGRPSLLGERGKSRRPRNLPHLRETQAVGTCYGECAPKLKCTQSARTQAEFDNLCFV